ncbi:hypothetical protein ACNVED_05835 [Legionella sp. D16C41]|uniref:hypothetical protein n=1 Tax=Legionella sp. D16C41 TaxID=3402688 RepID=UPI003AF86AE0
MRAPVENPLSPQEIYFLQSLRSNTMRVNGNVIVDAYGRPFSEAGFFQHSGLSDVELIYIFRFFDHKEELSKKIYNYLTLKLTRDGALISPSPIIILKSVDFTVNSIVKILSFGPPGIETLDKVLNLLSKPQVSNLIQQHQSIFGRESAGVLILNLAQEFGCENTDKILLSDQQGAAKLNCMINLLANPVSCDFIKTYRSMFGERNAAIKIASLASQPNKVRHLNFLTCLLAHKEYAESIKYNAHLSFIVDYLSQLNNPNELPVIKSDTDFKMFVGKAYDAVMELERERVWQELTGHLSVIQPVAQSYPQNNVSSTQSIIPTNSAPNNSTSSQVNIVEIYPPKEDIEENEFLNIVKSLSNEPDKFPFPEGITQEESTNLRQTPSVTSPMSRFNRGRSNSPLFSNNPGPGSERNQSIVPVNNQSNPGPGSERNQSTVPVNNQSNLGQTWLSFYSQPTQNNNDQSSIPPVYRTRNPWE